ncbi:hypothetical protein DFJ77DRAFT_468113 [Powellomyces hirtus]|nr:hypothetical protein DFJ77DRAFT_468113 [Powellomyces hirtus]
MPFENRPAMEHEKCGPLIERKLMELKEPVHEEVLPHEGPAHHRIIALALDQSDNSAYAFDWALANLINPQTDQVVLLNVRDVVSVPASFGLMYMDVTDWIDETEREYMIASHQLLKKYGGQVVRTGAKCRAIALRGDPRDEILHKVKEIEANMLVIGSRGMGTLKRTFLGSTSDYCVHHSPVPVVVVRRPPEEKPKKKDEKQTKKDT